VIDNYLGPLGYACDKLYQVTYGATTQDVRDSFNDGRIYGVYSGHGSSTSWADGPPFNQNDVRNLTNLGMYPWVLSFACVTGNFEDYTECFGETWIRVADKGAAAFYGSSVNSYWDEDDKLEKFVFEAIYDDELYEVSPAWQAAFVRYLNYYGPTNFTRRYFEMYNLMGDPALRVVITEEPCPADINGDAVVDVDDLFEVLNHWGDAGGDSDVNDDGVVDVDDLFEVLNAWGDCG
jgi:hypothetical protein